MEIKFNQTAVSFLRSLAEQVQTREETQEIRLTDGMPDIGRILGCWGQPIVRSKEWRSGGMGISGGVMVWVMYAPEDGTEPKTVEGWVPFQQKWEFEDNGRDGFIWVQPVLKSMDARSVSPRKIMVRANVATLGQAMQMTQADVYQPDHVPEDVELLRRSYPVELPVETGEKLVQLDEELTAPDSAMEKILCYSLMSRITEQKILGPRLVFKGLALLKTMYMSGGKIQNWEVEVPFSQYAELDRDLSGGAVGVIMPVVTDLELGLNEGRIHLKATVAAQYTIFDRLAVELTEDAYSPRREVEPKFLQLQLPARLDHWQGTAEQELTIPGEMSALADVSTMWDIPQCRSNEMTLNGTCQVLYYDPVGNLQSGTGKLEQTVELDQDSAAALRCSAAAWEKPKVSIHGEGVTISQAMDLIFSATGRQGMNMVTGMELGELREPDGGRPSLVLRRCQQESLWELAKEHGSTVAAIRSANALEGEPEPARMLLIPIA